MLVESRGESAECSVQNAAALVGGFPGSTRPQTPGPRADTRVTACSKGYRSTCHTTSPNTGRGRGDRGRYIARFLPYGESYGRHTVHTLPCSDELVAGSNKLADTYTYTAVRICTSSALLEYR